MLHYYCNGPFKSKRLGKTIMAKSQEAVVTIMILPVPPLMYVPSLEEHLYSLWRATHLKRKSKIPAVFLKTRIKAKITQLFLSDRVLVRYKPYLLFIEF